MKFCSGRNCPIQYDPEKPLDPIKCEAFRDCPHATIIDTDSFNWIDILSLLAIAKRDEITTNLQKLKEVMDEEINKRGQLMSETCPAPTPYASIDHYYCCDINSSKNNSFQTNCYYYHEEQHMNAHIPCCSVNGQYDPRNCNEQCPNYITRKQVDQLVKEHLATRKEIEDIKNG